MTEQQSSYRKIMKATSLFGGVQVLIILSKVISSKIIAVLLGTSGMGIIGLLNATTSLIASTTNLGLGTVGVKEISATYNTKDQNKIADTISIIRSWVWLTGLMGGLITLVFASWLSKLTFGNNNYTFAFVWLSISILFNQLTTGKLIILQGLRKLNYLAKANILGSILGLFCSAPLYYFYGLNGIVPSIILASLFSFIFSKYYVDKIPKIKTNATIFKTKEKGLNMVKFGFLLSLSNIITIGVSYIVRVYVNKIGSIDDVGLYNAGFAIINTYVGLIFTAMATDYYPRLSAIAYNNKLVSQSINQQGEIALLIIAPILAFFFIFINWAIILLYSQQFIGVNNMILWAALGMYFKAVSWAIAFLFLAKGATKVFFWSELSANIIILISNLLGYYYFGLDGLGISFFVSYFLYFVIVYSIAKNKYEFELEKEFIKIFGVQFFLGLTCFLVVYLLPNPYSYIIGFPLIVFSVWYSFKELDKRLGLKKFLNQIKNKI